MKILKGLMASLLSVIGIGCSDADRAQKHNKRALQLVQKQDLLGAEREWKKALELDPSLMNVQMNLGNLQLMQGNLDAAIQAYRAAADGGLEATELFSNLGVALKNSGKLEEALKAHKRALELAPDNIETLNNTSAAYLAVDDLDQAEKLLQKVLSISEENSNAHFNLGSIHLRRKQFDTAIEHFDKAAMDEHNKGAAKFAIAEAYSLQNEFTKALEQLKEALSVDQSLFDQLDQSEDLAALRATDEYKVFQEETLKKRRVTYAFMGSATATAKNKDYPEGKEMPIVVIAVGNKHEDANSKAVKHLEDTDWTNLKLQQGAVVDPNAFAQMESNIQTAYAAAQEHGAHSFIFND